MKTDKISKTNLKDGTIYNIGNHIQLIGKTYVDHGDKIMIELTDEQYNYLKKKLENYVKTHTDKQDLQESKGNQE